MITLTLPIWFTYLLAFLFFLLTLQGLLSITEVILKMKHFKHMTKILDSQLGNDINEFQQFVKEKYK